MVEISAVAVTLSRRLGPWLLALALLLANNPLLLDCTAFWTDRGLRGLRWLAQWSRRRVGTWLAQMAANRLAALRQEQEQEEAALGAVPDPRPRRRSSRSSRSRSRAGRGQSREPRSRDPRDGDPRGGDPRGGDPGDRRRTRSAARVNRSASRRPPPPRNPLVARTVVDKLALWCIRWHRRHLANTANMAGVYPPPLPVPRQLCPNGDHGNVEETGIVVGEHFRRILGTVVLALFLAWLVAAPPRPSANVPTSGVFGESARTDSDPSWWDSDLPPPPPAYHRRPPSQFAHGADPRESDGSYPVAAAGLVVHSSSPPPPRIELPPIGASGFAAARKAARAAQNAQREAAAIAYLAAVRQRIIDQNNQDDGGGVGGLHTDDNDELALALPVFGLDGGDPASDASALFYNPDIPDYGDYYTDDVHLRHGHDSVDTHDPDPVDTYATGMDGLAPGRDYWP